ncbi:hypothetical protein C8039_00735 [Halogeometricum sp. wsp3]|nr:hypothetical protein C8039_00735 [Halogeometricum sp. wsp3]
MIHDENHHESRHRRIDRRTVPNRSAEVGIGESAGEGNSAEQRERGSDEGYARIVFGITIIPAIGRVQRAMMAVQTGRYRRTVGVRTRPSLTPVAPI